LSKMSVGVSKTSVEGSKGGVRVPKMGVEGAVWQPKPVTYKFRD